mmetsp:Transcript_93114/g.301038  ORF Transcript_93114/g.301038 Transcript_93114/m.301038 type:complete len:203 (+) Transcript_93114:2275-2883(+)
MDFRALCHLLLTKTRRPMGPLGNLCRCHRKRHNQQLRFTKTLLAAPASLPPRFLPMEATMYRTNVGALSFSQQMTLSHSPTPPFTQQMMQSHRHQKVLVQENLMIASVLSQEQKIQLPSNFACLCPAELRHQKSSASEMRRNRHKRKEIIRSMSLLEYLHRQRHCHPGCCTADFLRLRLLTAQLNLARLLARREEKQYPTRS